MRKYPIPALILTASISALSWAAEARQSAAVPANPPTTPEARPSDPAPLAWLTDLPAALDRAKSDGKSVLLFFHGSDWCPTCAQMQRQVFASPEFIQFARRSLVLVDVDFPEKQNQSDSLKQANLALKSRFNLGRDSDGAFPTIVLLNAAGATVFQETGYAGGGSAEVLPNLRRHTEVGAAATDCAVFKNLGVEEFARLAADRQNVILDVRTAGEFAAGHLPRAINLDVNAADFQARAALLDKDKTYLVHCASGARSVKACEQLGRLDFPKLYNLVGGFRAWAQAGKPVEK